VDTPPSPVNPANPPRRGWPTDFQRRCLWTALTAGSLLATAAIAVYSLGIVAKVRGGLPDSLLFLRDGFTEIALPGAFAVALGSTLGSLYLSGVAKFPACILCWGQRACMYPLVGVLLYAWLAKKVSLWMWVFPVVGIGISTYHYTLERFPNSLVCPSNGVDCSVTLVWKFHFLSIPGMAWAGFATILALMGIAAAGQRRAANTVPADDVPQELTK
jgi:disulfide bond formation protein DsbB